MTPTSNSTSKIEKTVVFIVDQPQIGAVYTIEQIVPLVYFPFGVLLTFDLDYASAESRRNLLDLCYALANLICATNSSFLRVSYGCHYCPPEGGFEDAQHLLHHEPPCIGVILGLALPQIEKTVVFIDDQP